MMQVTPVMQVTPCYGRYCYYFDSFSLTVKRPLFYSTDFFMTRVLRQKIRKSSTHYNQNKYYVI